MALTLIVLVGLLAFGIVWLAGTDRGQQRQRLSDGSTISLLGVTFGDQHRFLTGPRWQQLLWRLDIPQLRDRLTDTGERFRMNPVPRSMVLWTRHNTDARWRWGGGAKWEAFDETGAAVTVENSGAYGADGASDRHLEPLAVETFPRRGSMVGFRWIDQRQNPKRLYAEFRVPNPDPGPHPTWKAASLPATVERAGLKFQLLRFATHTQWPRSELYDADVMPWTTATFRISRKGRQAMNWYPSSVIFDDATGNHFEPRHTRSVASGPDPVYGLEGLLDPRETYRLRVKFSNDEDFGGENRWQLPLLRLPHRGSRQPLSLSSKRGDLTVKVVELSGRGRKIDPVVDHSGPFLKVFHSGPEADDVRIVLLKAVDQSGRELDVNGGVTFYPGKGFIYFGLEDLRGVKAVRVTLGVRQSQVVEFLAKPVDATKPLQR